MKNRHLNYAPTFAMLLLAAILPLLSCSLSSNGDNSLGSANEKNSHWQGNDNISGNEIEEAKAIKRFQVWLEKYKKQAIADGLPELFVIESLADVHRPDPRIYKHDVKQPGRSLTLQGYIKRLELDQRKNSLQKEWQRVDTFFKNRPDLSVNGSLLPTILSIWSLESSQGRNAGHYNVINSLATLAWMPRRSRYFTKELTAALELAYKEKWSISDYKGSWAGAAGPMQLMPSNIKAYGRDGNGDNIIDPVNNDLDAFASGATMLRSLGWDNEERWGWQVRLAEGFDLESMGKTLTWHDWQQLGLQVSYGTAPRDKALLTLRAPLGLSGPAWLTGENYKRILKWNRSHYYALSVGILADLVQEHAVDPFWQLSFIPDSLHREDVIYVQSVLKEMGFYQGSIDGIFGGLSRAALWLWERSTQGRLANGILDAYDIQLLRSAVDN